VGIRYARAVGHAIPDSATTLAVRINNTTEFCLINAELARIKAAKHNNDDRDK
jgi:hypothetical protein